MKILSNQEFEILTKDQSPRLKAIAKQRVERHPKGFITEDDLDPIIRICAYSGDERAVKWLKSLKSFALSGKLQQIKRGYETVQDHFKYISYLHKKGEIAFDIGNHIILKDTGKHGTVVDYNPETKEFAVVLSPFQLQFFEKKDLEKVAKVKR